ncbi:MAG TPA: OPT/YSL family transporter, partial [Myxococcales bacterium]|nr:OPT/YSL family transporter [Myxococcales bacterium]
ITCGLFVAVGWTGVGYKAMALTTAALVCVAASNGGTTSQDLKTGFLVGSTPRFQQIAILVGVITSALVIGVTLQLLNEGHTTFKPVVFPEHTPVVAADATRQLGPDKKTEYRVHYVREDDGNVARGKYLVDDSGKLAFLVDPGVCGTFPYKLEEPASPIRLDAPADAPTELGMDRQPYRLVHLTEPRGEVPTGRYLVAADGRVAYVMTDLWKFDAPKAQLFRLIIDGTLGGKLPWGLVLVGMFLAIIIELLGVASLPFAVGLYLPVSTSAGIFVGGMVRSLVDRKRSDSGSSAEFSPGVLMASGLIAGGAIAGVVQSIIAFNEKEKSFDVSSYLGTLAHNESWWPMLPFLLMAGAVYYVGTRKERAAPAPSGS